MSPNTNRPKKFSFFDLFRSRKDNIKASRASETAVREEVSVPTNLEKKRLTDTLWWTFEDGVLTIGGEGMMPDFQWCSRKAFPWPDQETVAVIISEGVLRIGAGSFLRCSNLSEVTLPASLCAIGAYAFEATGINEIALPKGLVCIEDSVFKSCKQLSKVIIPDSVAEIKRHSFEYCEKLTYVHLPNSLKRIGSHAFYRTGITEIELPDGLEMIGKTAFGHLSHLMIPDSVTQCETPIAFPCPVQFPKGREDMPVFEPKTDEDYFRQFAYQFFSARPDVLEEPTGEPAKDRYTAIARLLEIMQQYFHAKPNRLYDSYASKGELFLCNDAEIEYGESCADGGCGPSYETIRFGVTFSIITEEELFCQRSEMQLAQTDPFPIWKSKDGKQCLLYHPLGLSDCFSIKSDYAVCPENPIRQAVSQQTVLPRSSTASISFPRNTLRFSSEGMFGDQIDLRIEPGKGVTVSCYYAPPPSDRFGGGGYERPMPEELVHNYDQTRFVEWLRSTFWGGLTIHPLDENEVKLFLREAKLPSGPNKNS